MKDLNSTLVEFIDLIEEQHGIELTKIMDLLQMVFSH
jgi:hypothetical protein